MRLPVSRFAPRVLVFAGLLALAACGSNLSQTFGLTRDAPDEFRVTTTAPLSMPPDFALKPPEPGAPRPNQMSQRQQAEAVLVPQAALGGGNTGMSAGQQALVSAAGPPAPANIRQQVDATAAREANNRSLTDELMFWKTPPQPGIVVDPTKEAQRLREDAALGESPQTGVTPIIQPKSHSWLSDLF